MFWRKWFISDRLNFVGLILASVFSVVSLCKTCSHENEIEQLDYKLNAINYQPQIGIIGDPTLEQIWTDTMRVGLKIADFFNRDSSDVPTYATSAKVHLRIGLKLVNGGNSLAKIISIITGDTTSADEVLRRRFLDPKYDKFVFDPFSPFFKSELLPNSNDTLLIKHTEDIDFIEDQLFTLHILIVYENELGHIYDTYYWTQFKIEKILIPSPISVKDSRIYLAPKSFKIAKKDFLKFTNSKTSYRTYDHQEAKYVINQCRKIIEELELVKRDKKRLNE